MINIKKVNESFLKLTGDHEDLIVVSEFFTRYAPNYLWNPRYKAGVWDGKIRLFNMLNGLIPFGLLEMLMECIAKNNIEIENEINSKNIEFNKTLFKDILEEFKNFIPHEHQIRGAMLALKNGRGLIEHATSSGKTATLYFILKYYMMLSEDSKIMVVVPTKSLIKQFCSDFKEYGMNPNLVGCYYQEEKDLTRRITVGTWQSLKDIPDYLETVDIAIADEVHHAKAIEIKSLFEHCINASIRIGVTGSLHKNECDRLSIIGGFGPVLDIVKTDELIKKNLVSPVEIIQIDLYYDKEIVKKFKKEYEETKMPYHIEKLIINNDKRRMLMVRKLIEKQKDGENILLLFDELNFGQMYFDYLKKEFPAKFFKYVSGVISATEREEIRKFASENENVVIVASLGTFSTGINIPRLHAIIFLWVGKSDVRLKQSIGRGLRKHLSKDKLIIYDICDQLKFSKQHAAERLKIYMGEGFPVKIIEVGKKSS